MTARTLALEALKITHLQYDSHPYSVKLIDDAIAALEAETGEPYAWAISACSRMWFGEFAELDAKAEAARCGGTCEAFPLYTAPVPAVPGAPA